MWHAAYSCFSLLFFFHFNDFGSVELIKVASSFQYVV